LIDSYNIVAFLTDLHSLCTLFSTSKQLFNNKCLWKSVF